MVSVGQSNQNSRPEHEQVAASVAAAFGHAPETQGTPQTPVPQEEVVTQPQTPEPAPSAEKTVDQTLADGQGIEQAREGLEQMAEAAVGAVTAPVTNATQTIEHHFTEDQHEADLNAFMKSQESTNMNKFTDGIRDRQFSFTNDFVPKSAEQEGESQ
ncbi:hypothetical protein HY065_00035 [Candidatus Berkelbacteria bacterium]|nr:hypothetical protein [Candidatus Berkelbacteria bacterium]